MKVAVFFAVICLLAAPAAQANATIASVQETLKSQGFYYGEITGRKDADTAAAIRRYQIRNGLQITGELNAETQKSLGIKGAATTRPANPRPAPGGARPAPTPPDISDLRDDAPAVKRPAQPTDDSFGPQPPQAYSPAVPALGDRALFHGTPYDTAPPDVQRRVIIGTQSLLARRGYYRSGIDGVFGSGTEFALRAYQSRFGIEPSGRFDMETLAALGLLPNQQAPGLTAPTGRLLGARPSYRLPSGERIYVPR